MSDQIPLLLGEVRGELKALRVEHDRHACLARQQFDRLNQRLDELRGDLDQRRIARARRGHVVDGLKWVAMLAAALFAGHVGGSAH